MLSRSSILVSFYQVNFKITSKSISSGYLMHATKNLENNIQYAVRGRENIPNRYGKMRETIFFCIKHPSRREVQHIHGFWAERSSSLHHIDRVDARTFHLLFATHAAPLICMPHPGCSSTRPLAPAMDSGVPPLPAQGVVHPQLLLSFVPQAPSPPASWTSPWEPLLFRSGSGRARTLWRLRRWGIALLNACGSISIDTVTDKDQSGMKYDFFL
jgi:hypothetical protein